jgi:hypothetical protein
MTDVQGILLAVALLVFGYVCVALVKPELF